MADKILVVDDDPDVALFVEIHLRESGFDVAMASRGDEAIEAARSFRPDLVVLDVMLPGVDGFEVAQQIRSDPRTAGMGIIILTGRTRSADRVLGLTAGADDYIVKPFDPVELVARVKGLLRRVREMRSASPLTGFPGNLSIQRELGRLVEQDRPFALLYADLDNFKAFNDRYGFLRGDRAIQSAARVIQDAVMEIVGEGTFVGHVGGDDFVVICPPLLAERLSEAIADRLGASIPQLYDREDRERGAIEITDRRGEVRRYPLMSVSIGVATTERRRFSHPSEPVNVATEMKEYAKRITGSSWAVDRRRIEVDDVEEAEP